MMATGSSERDDSPKEILIVLMGALGDVVRGLCMVQLLKNRFPEARITWLIEDKWKSVVELHSEIDELLVFERRRGVAGAIATLRDLRSRNFDLTLDLQRHLKSGICSWFSGAKRRIGFHPRNAKEFNFVFNNEHIPFFPDSLPKIKHYVQFVQHLGGEVKEPFEFGFDSFDASAVLAGKIDTGKRPYVALVLGSSWPSKDWVFDGYAGIAHSVLRESESGIVLLGDRSQTETAAKLIDSLGSPRVYNTVGKTSLVELVALLKAAQVCMGPDSGPGHIAAAVGTPYVSVFGATDPVRTAPYQCENYVVRSSIGCSPCYRRCCPGLDRLCMRLIPVQSVWEKMRPFTA